MKNSNTFRSARLLIAVVAAASCCFAVDPHRAISQYVHDHWGPEQGFPRGPVYAIAQTSDGYLWIGSEAGLLRFDGVHYGLMHDPSGLYSPSRVLGLAADPDGSLWILLPDMTLVRYRNGKFERPGSKLPMTGISVLSRGNHGAMLAAKMQMGAYTYRNDELSVVGRARGVPRSPIIAVGQAANGDVWLGTRGSGLFRVAGGVTTPVLRGLPDLKVNAVLPAGGAAMWIGTDNGIVRWDGSQLTAGGIPPVLQRSQILAMAKDRDQNLWIGADTGQLFRYDVAGVVSEMKGSGDAGTAITAIFEGREGSIWIARDGSLDRIRDSPFVTYSRPEGVDTDGSNPVHVDSGNRTWFAPESGGLEWFREGHQEWIRAGGLDRDVVYSISGAGDDLWAGRQRGGLTNLHFSNGRAETKTWTQADGLAQNSVYSVYSDRSGAIWAGTLSGGVSRLDHGKFTTYTASNGLATNMVASILQTSDGTMWFGTPGGLSSLVHSRWRTFVRQDGLPSENINCLLEDKGGVLWVGTTAGLAYRGGDRFLVPAGLPASLKEEVLGIAEDRLGALWIATAHHVLRVTRDTLLQGALNADDVREYSFTDGLRGTEGVKRHRSVVSDSLGRIWFSLNRGISVVDPARLTGASAPAMPDIQTFSADGVPVAIGNDIHVAPRAQRLVFSYASLCLTLPERTRFRYFLENYDHQWSAPQAETEASYTSVGPGLYRLRVIAANSEGAWSSQEASLTFRVDPAYWQTWWFRVIAAVLVCAAIFALYRLRLRQLTSGLNVRFEERLAERTRIAQELHDTLLQGFLSASMQVHVSVSRLPADSPVRPSLAKSVALMNRVIEEGRNAVRGLRSTSSASMDLESAFSAIEEEIAHARSEGTPQQFRVISDGTVKPLNPIIRDEVYRIGREALLNAFRHSGAQKIEIELTYSARSFGLLVRDDGCGIAPDTLSTGREGHWGLAGMRERSERIGARLRLWSDVGRGTEVELSVPRHVAYESKKTKS